MDVLDLVGPGHKPDPTRFLPRDITSAVTDDEAHALADLAAGRVVLEVGAHWGFSTVVMAQVAEVVHSVDWHRGGDGVGWADSLPEFRRNLDRYGVQDRTVIHVGLSEDILPVLRHSRFGLVFIDGSHSFESVVFDVEYALALVEPGSVIAMHDWGRFDVADAYRAVTDRPVDIVIDSLAVVRSA